MAMVTKTGHLSFKMNIVYMDTHDMFIKKNAMFGL